MQQRLTNTPGVTVDAAMIRDRIAQLQTEHHDLDTLIGKMATVPGINDLELRRLKKRKLKVKDTIILLQLQLEPDAH
ncbi:DUF465 domain-containing protein [Caballeronia telluris]|jgi:hypothetical protein|uniref:DUF465 domain-containing protein n=1 Tax=Caballeronia telluris TaxID=326475 RepID=A0A158HGV5_9BURK|nr:DUF465 domain-containing protein [Caballeronia telluris]SAL43357.1 hypothetical protein AWB66_02312 [Caballeronia telluris]